MSTLQEAIQNPLVHDSAIMMAEGLGFVALTTLYQHREITHESLKLKPALKTMARTAMWFVGIRPRIWAGVHRQHHSCTDANLAPILETADYLEYRDMHPEITEPPIPDTFRTLDPAAELSPDQIKHIGGLARTLVEGRYERPSAYSTEETTAILDTETPRYFYPKKRSLWGALRRKPKEPETVHDSLLGVLPDLRDPHSPVLHKRGVYGINRDNVHRYRSDAAYRQQQEDAGKDFGRTKWDKRLFDKSALGITAFAVGNIALQYAIQHTIDPIELTEYAAIGGAMTIGAGKILIKGGDATNAGGHGGRDMFRSYLLRRPPKVKRDGTFTSNSRSLSLPTFDEVGGQDEHHRDPSLIAYTSKEGIAGVIDAPFGSSAKACADHGILMEHGDQFGGVPLAERPDMPSQAVLELEQARRDTLNKRFAVAA